VKTLTIIVFFYAHQRNFLTHSLKIEVSHGMSFAIARTGYIASYFKIKAGYQYACKVPLFQG
jgi:hypothetical protein